MLIAAGRNIYGGFIGPSVLCSPLDSEISMLRLPFRPLQSLLCRSAVVWSWLTT